MPSVSLHDIQRLCKWSTVTLGALCLVMVAAAFVHPGDALYARVIRNEQKQMPWRVFEMDEVDKGVSVLQDTNIVFHLPLSMTETPREVLLGHRGKEVRYWGYCFPQNYDPKVVEKRQGLPGLLFLSEKEREIREAINPSLKEPAFSPFNLPTKREVEVPQQFYEIRHQIESFTAGMMCYLMTEATLTLGPDADGDGLNAQLEREIGTNHETPDSDGDGIWDGIEYLGKTNPLLRDTDSDGLIDGIEDKNWNGKINKGESDPKVWDSDRDGLCDGYCRVRLGNGKQVFLGEDLNLNGKLDTNETSPVKLDTDGDTLIDYQERLNCLQKPGGAGC